MRIALIAPPFIPIPPPKYGGTELFVEQLALGLKALGHEVVVYTNGESTVDVEKRWLFAESEWPLKDDVYFSLRDLQHHSWAVHDAAKRCDIIHVNNLAGIAFSKFVNQPFVNTVHHPLEKSLSSFYSHYPNVHHACISHFQAKEHKVLNSTTIHHGLNESMYRLSEVKEDYLVFLGRIAPVKGVHLAIEAAKKAGMPLKIAGQVQPLYNDYFEQQVKPHLDGKNVEFVGEMGLTEKNELLGKARALLFPIQWHEPFGLVMVESMACGTPVLAFAGGSVAEIVEDGVSGYICKDTDEMAERAKTVQLPAKAIRAYVEEKFSLRKMVQGYVDLYEKLLNENRKQPASEGLELESNIA
ncbi:MAG TPA: glycosyltransferase family 4 protein [Terriglobales bacterium]|nr:glycosyltransferase family 4 protein [Terriglobales bacterium]